MKVLIVDDEPGMRFMLERVLRANDHEVATCENAADAWDIYQEDAFPIAILDWMMPGMDGLELCRRMRSTPHGPETVILVITARSRFEDLQQVLDAGADDYLAKPVHVNDLKVRLAIAEEKVRAISERKRIADAIIRAKKEWERTFDSVPESIAIIDADGCITRINQAMADRVGRAPRELVGLRCGELAPGLENSPVWRPHAEMMKDGKERTEEVREPILGGHLLVSASPFCDPSGRLIGSVHTSRDITELKRAQEQLAEARKQEGQIAANIQKTLLLGHPPKDVSGVQIGSHTIPSEQVDGDFFDFFLHSPRCFDLLVGDVMGKGFPAALQSAAMKHEFLRTRADMMAGAGNLLPPEPAEIVTAVHGTMTPKLIALESSVTVCYARFDQSERRVKYVDCGHTKTVHYRRSKNACENLAGDSVPLGYLADETYGQKTTSFDMGDIFFFYSDGITEARDASGEFFGEERLAELIVAYHGLEASDLVGKVIEDVMAFSKEGALKDDVTCVAIRMVGHDDWVPRAHDEFEILSRLDKLSSARAFAKRFCEQVAGLDVADTFLDQLELAINETVSNIIKHAYAGQTDKKIQIEAEAFPDRVCFRFYDSGPPFRPSAIRPPTFERSRDGGFGLYIIDRCVDEMKYYQTEDGRNCTCLIKRTVG